MSCEGNRGRYLSYLWGTEGYNPAVLERVFQAGRRTPVGKPEQALAKAKTMLLFADMRRAGFAPPVHSPSGLPRSSARMGYAAMWDELQKLRRQASAAAAQRMGVDALATPALQDADFSATMSAMVALGMAFPDYLEPDSLIETARSEMARRLVREGPAAISDARALAQRVQAYLQWRRDAAEMGEYLLPDDTELVDRFDALDFETPPMVLAAALQDGVETLSQFTEDEYALGLVERAQGTIQLLTGAEESLPADAPRLDELPIYEGRAWRSETGYQHDRGSTAADVVRYEQDDLGNDLGVSDGLLSELETISAEDGRTLVWVTRTKKDAARYGGAKPFPVSPGAVILAEDGDGGCLVLNEYPQRSIRALIQVYQQRDGKSWPVWATPDNLAQVYRLGRREPANEAEALLARTKTMRLFEEMGREGILAPWHYWAGKNRDLSGTWASSRELMGYAAVYDTFRTAESRRLRNWPGEKSLQDANPAVKQNATQVLEVDVPRHRAQVEELMQSLAQLQGNEDLLVRGEGVLQDLGNLRMTSPVWSILVVPVLASNYIDDANLRLGRISEAELLQKREKRKAEAEQSEKNILRQQQETPAQE